MRKILISMLLASAAAGPAFAAPRDWSDRQQTREDRQSQREERQSAREDQQSAREERQSARDDRQPAREQRVQVREQRVNDVASQARGPAQVDVRQQAVERNVVREQRRDARQDARTERVVQHQQVIDDRQQDMRETRQLRQSARPTPNVMHTRNPLIVSDTPQRGTQPPLRAERRRSPDVHWNTSWRNNHRYDWHNHRRHHRSLFHLGLYYDPYGWGYQPFSIGWRLWPSYYSNRYWINDPWMYRLPYAPMGYVWVRYWNDAMLVDTWTGTVVDVIPGFFW